MYRLVTEFSPADSENFVQFRIFCLVYSIRKGHGCFPITAFNLHNFGILYFVYYFHKYNYQQMHIKWLKPYIT
jgi:hypothetical protein